MISDGPDSYLYYIQQFKHAKKEAEELIIPLDDRIFRRQPSANSWCIGECFSHLVQTGTLYYKEVETGIQQATTPSSGAKNPMHIRFHMKWFVNYLEPPITTKTKTFAPFQPVAYVNLDKDEILNAFLKLQDQYLSQMELAKNQKLDLSKVKVSNPIFSFIKMTVSECIAITEAHQRRHIEQAKKTLELL